MPRATYCHVFDAPTMKKCRRAFALGFITAVIGFVVVQFAVTVFSRLSPRDGNLYSRPRIVPTEDRIRRAIKDEGFPCFDASGSMKLAGRIGENSVLTFDCSPGVAGSDFVAGSRYVITFDGDGDVLSIRDDGTSARLPVPIP